MVREEMTARFSEEPERLIRVNLAVADDKIDAACARVVRPRSAVTRLPVTKTGPSEILRQAVKAGFNTLGKNKVEQAQAKANDMAALSATWISIGHLQISKVKSMLTLASEFQPLHSLRLAGLVDDRLMQLGRKLDNHAQVNTSGGASKYGIAPEDADTFANELSVFPALQLRGLITLAILKRQPDDVRACFRRLRHLRDRFVTISAGRGFERLSMGMTSAFDMPIEKGLPSYGSVK